MKGRLSCGSKNEARGTGLLLPRPFGHLMKNGQVAMMSEGQALHLMECGGAVRPTFFFYIYIYIYIYINCFNFFI
jgi:hypothetical protein